MASVDITLLVDDHYKESEYLKILSYINRNAFQTDVADGNLKCGFSRFSCAFKKNVERYTYYERPRRRSKSENHKSVCETTNCQFQCYPLNQTRTYSGIRTMHDKGINICVMPENVPELLLDGYSNSKQNFKWQSSNNAHCQSITNHPLASAKFQINDENDRNGFNEDYEYGACQRDRTVGIKRMRDESPNFLCSNSEPATDAKDCTFVKVQQKCMGTDTRNIRISEDAQQSDFNGLNGRLNKTCNGFQVMGESPPESPVNYCDSIHVKSKRSKIFNTDCAVVLFNAAPANAALLKNDTWLDLDCDQAKQEKNAHAEGTPDEKCDITFEPEYVQVICRGNGDLHPGLRKSLFPCVPPYIKFCSHDEKVDLFPINVHKLLRWKLSTITPLVVRKVVSNSGYRLLKKSTFWGGTWGKHTKSVVFKTLFEYQKMNHFPGSFQIGRKDRLWKSLQKLMSKHGKHKFDLMPTTYILPQDKRILKLAWKKFEGKEPWIIKPPASARGTGIKVVHKWSQIPDNTPLIVQKYISRPYLINDTKFDLRLYVLVTSMNPLRIYLYDNGLVRFASVKYSTELNTLGDRYMHLTNYSINKLSSKYKQNEDATACRGHKWTLKTLWTYMKNELNVDVSKTWSKLIDLIIKTVISGENSITNLIDDNLGSRYNSYELFGVDVLFDVDLKPWLLEVNISPSLHSASPLDLAVKAPLVRDLMNIVGFHIPNSKKCTETELCENMGNVADNKLCFDSRLYTRTISYSEKQKHNRFTRKSRDEYLDAILEDLTPDDVRHLIQYEDELTQLGSFQKIFPTWKTHEYLQYLDNPKYYNLLFDAWETKYHENRGDGIRLLGTKCKEGVHLKISKRTFTSSKVCETLSKCQRQSQNNAFAENTTYPKNSYLSLRVKTASYVVKPRYRLRHPFVPSKTYLLRSRKVW